MVYCQLFRFMRRTIVNDSMKDEPEVGGVEEVGAEK